MQLRHHPKLIHHGVSYWPLAWTSTGATAKTVVGEVGIITNVNSNFQIHGKCFLVIDHEDETYVGINDFLRVMPFVKNSVNCSVVI